MLLHQSVPVWWCWFAVAVTLFYPIKASSVASVQQGSSNQLSDIDSFVSDDPLVALLSDDESSGDGSAAAANDISSGLEEPSSGQEEEEEGSGGGELLVVVVIEFISLVGQFPTQKRLSTSVLFKNTRIE